MGFLLGLTAAAVSETTRLASDNEARELGRPPLFLAIAACGCDSTPTYCS
jgi:hypothetical protein